MAARTPAHPGTADEAFKKHVVETAMKYAKRHDWCAVVIQALTEMGLAEYLPPKFMIQVKHGRRDSWIRYASYGGDEREARREFGRRAETRRQSAITAAVKPYEIKINLRDSKMNAQQLLTLTQQAVEAREKAANAPLEITYPIFRLVKQPDGARVDNGIIVIDSEPEPPVKPRKPAAKKTVAKKAPAKKTAARAAV